MTISDSYQQQKNHGYDAVPRVENELEDNIEVLDNSLSSYPGPLFRKAKQWKMTLMVSGLAVLGLMAMVHNNASPQPDDISVGIWGSSYSSRHAPHKAEWQIPHYYNDQLVDHFADDTTTWPHRYYVSSKYFKGPGHPLIVIMGGEGPVDEVFYPFVKNTLAKDFGAYVLQTEHRFYGTSIPTKAGAAALPTNEEFRRLLSPDQAMEDFVRLIHHIQGEIGCSGDRLSADYCPVITVGASYPGFLSAMMRFVYPDVVDMSYASSAPLLLYAQAKDTELYFDYVTEIAEAASPGCAEAYKKTLQDVHDEVSSMSIDHAARKLGVCRQNIPHYIQTPEVFAEELTMLVGFANADFNMDYHPPGDRHADVIKGCEAFQRGGRHTSSMDRMYEWLKVKAESGATDHPGEKCYDLHWDIPSGKYARITGADWSGMGDGDTATTWEFQCCSDLIIETGFGPNSMFLERPFDLEWLTQHCQRRFGVTPTPTRMVDKWHFDELVEHGASYILFTNGLQDGWSPLSYTEDLSDTILALNFPTGAHHSDLNECFGCKHGEEKDIIQGRKDIARILRGWLDEQRDQAKAEAKAAEEAAKAAAEAAAAEAAAQPDAAQPGAVPQQEGAV